VYAIDRTVTNGLSETPLAQQTPLFHPMDSNYDTDTLGNEIAFSDVVPNHIGGNFLSSHRPPAMQIVYAIYRTVINGKLKTRFGQQTPQFHPIVSAFSRTIYLRLGRIEIGCGCIQIAKPKFCSGLLCTKH
jgi:hypothetical protein